MGGVAVRHKRDPVSKGSGPPRCRIHAEFAGIASYDQLLDAVRLQKLVQIGMEE